MTEYTKLIERVRVYEQDHAPDGWPAIKMRDVSTLADAIEALQTECAEHKENAMRNARIAVSIRAERDQLQAENERLQSALAQCRDAFPIPAQGSALEQDWAAAMGEPESVPDFVKASVDAMSKGESIYQYQMGDGSWIDQTKHSYDYNRNHAPNAVVRIVYAAPKALAPHEDTKLLDYLQARQATVEILMDGHGLSTPLFRIGGLHGTICADIRGAIGAAIESLKEPTP